MTDRCDSCRFWRRLTDGQGQCRRNAPAAWVSPATRIDPPRVSWPLTLASEGCGEWGAPALVQPSEQDREMERLGGLVEQLRLTLAEFDRMGRVAVAKWREAHPGAAADCGFSVAIDWLIRERAGLAIEGDNLRIEMARLSRAAVDGEGDEED